MYLPSKSKLNSKYIIFFLIPILLFSLPFKNFIQNILDLLSQKIIFAPYRYAQELQGLKEKNAALALKNNEALFLKEENERLKKALNFYETQKINLTGAEIISFDLSNWRRVVRINIGQNKGVTKGLYAIDEDGWFVGKIIETNKTFSRLIFVTDPDFSIPVFIGETSFGLLKGSLDVVKILYIENYETINAGDKIWLKSSSLSFPLIIGEIKECRKNRNSLFWDVEVKLFSQNPSLHKIFIVK